MNIFEEIKENSDILEVCNMLGIKLDRNNKAKCPFHNEKTASFSISTKKQIYFCFGCGKGGDSIKLVSEIYNISALEAAKMINENLNLGIQFKNTYNKGTFKVNKYSEKQKIKNEFDEWKRNSFITLCNYWHLLLEWEKISDFGNDKFVEALQKKDNIEYWIDEYFINGNDDDKLYFWKHKRRELNDIEERVRLYRQVS